ncbi:hypothetical protein [Burkholderia gladioli]|nr:hypothetical protein [Burkholderia gladioli]
MFRRLLQGIGFTLSLLLAGPSFAADEFPLPAGSPAATRPSTAFACTT